MKVFNKTDILLPESADMQKWSVIACDQYTAQPEYWESVKEFVADSPSTLNIVYPEAYLSEGDGRIDKINATMKKYVDDKIFKTLKDSLIYVERTINSGKIRRGIVGAIDLECYDYSKGSKSEIRATEGTILDRIPPRVKIRENASLELPHAILLMNDKDDDVIGKIVKKDKVYDFDLMQGGGHISGWQISGEVADAVIDRIEKYQSTVNDNLIFAVGDGNHSLATAKSCWETIKKGLSEEERKNHPARFCLVEIENIHDAALEFEPIHRIVFNVDGDEVLDKFKEYYQVSNTYTQGAQKIEAVVGDRTEELYVKNPSSNLEVGTLQKFLDDMKYELDYIHGSDVVYQLAKKENTIGFILPCPDKSQLFEAVIKDGALPRKTFSMGEANEKRYYLEAKKIK